MAITDLKGTTWEVKSGWQASAGYGKFSIECGITLPDGSGTVYGVLAIGYAPNNIYTQYVSTANSIAWGETAFPHNGVTNTSTVTLEDISGADTTNTSLIQWLETYGELQVDTFQVPVDAPEGVRLLVEGTVCEKNIDVVPKLQEKAITPQAEAQEVLPDSGNAGLSKVVVDAIPDGYVIPTGSVTIKENGTHDVSGKASAVVSVPIPDGYVIPEGSVTITENGTHDVSGKASAVVSVPDSPLPTEISTEAEMTALLEMAEVGGVYRYTGTSGTYENGALYVLEEAEEYNLTLVPDYQGTGMDYASYLDTYVKLNYQPTSSSDFDYYASRLSSEGVTVKASSYWIWGFALLEDDSGKNYTYAEEVVLTEDTTVKLPYYIFDN